MLGNKSFIAYSWLVDVCVSYVAWLYHISNVANGGFRFNHKIHGYISGRSGAIRKFPSYFAQRYLGYHSCPH